MATLSSDSETAVILDRRKHLRRQRRLMFLVATWRSLAIMGLTGTLIWAATLAEWKIYRPQQVVIRGNHLLSTEAILKLLPLDQAKSLLQLQPKSIAATLESTAPISRTTIARQILPTQLIIEVQERPPVAVVTCDRCTLLQHPTGTPAIAQGPASIWLLDQQGKVAPLSSYPSLQKSGKLPPLKVLGLFKAAPADAIAASGIPALKSAAQPVVIDSQRQFQWVTLYEILHRNPVKVSTIDWQSSSNLIIKTQLGTAHLGPFGSKFADQLQALDKMRKLPSQVSPQQLAHVDLRNPDAPLLEMRPSSKVLSGNQP
jgi:cell division protein FtsQ